MRRPGQVSYRRKAKKGVFFRPERCRSQALLVQGVREVEEQLRADGECP